MSKGIDSLKLIDTLPPRQKITLIEFAGWIRGLLNSDPKKTIEDVSIELQRDIRFVRRVLAIAEHMNTSD